jgi:D-arabinose 1-dehydrogenase-like Zn-dependent alcohol dehydrogenase
MKALVFEKYYELVYKDVADPEIKSDEVLVKIMACGICGTDVHGLDGRKTVELFTAIYRSSRNNIAVKFPQKPEP